jgi:hypothetical protein
MDRFAELALRPWRIVTCIMVQALFGMAADHPQATERWIIEKIRPLRQSDVVPFQELLEVEMANK